MGHFAKVDESNIVREVIVVANAAMNDLPFPDSEPGQELQAMVMADVDLLEDLVLLE